MPSFSDDYRNLEEIDDESALKDIFFNDSGITVRIKAQEKIKDKGFLYDECLNNPSGHLRIACLNHILDDDLGTCDEKNSLLRHLTLNDPELDVRLIACENLSEANQDVLCQIADSGCDVALRRQAISKLDDETALKKFALNDEDRFVRLEAIQNRNMVDLETLSQIILNDCDEFNRYCACGKIPDEESFLKIIYNQSTHSRLPELAKNTYFSLEDYFSDVYDNLDTYKKIVALNFITDESFLEDVVLNESRDELRAEAIKNPNFNNQEILNDLISNETNCDILLQAVGKVENEIVLESYVKNNLKVNDIVLEAISKITDYEFLKDLSGDAHPEIRMQAVRQMSKLRDANYFFDSILYDVAINEQIKDIRMEAIGAIVKKNDLINIVDRLSDTDSRLEALKNINEDRLIDNYITSNHKSIIRQSLDDSLANNTLNRIALSDGDVEVRKIAASKLSDKDVLDKMAGDVDESVMEAAKNRLDTLWEDIKLISDENILKEIYSNGDADVQIAVKNQIDDLKTWKDRISQIRDIDDIETLKDIALNDYNYYVRCEAEGKLETLLFDIRLDELKNPENIKKLSKIALDDSYPKSICDKAFVLLG